VSSRARPASAPSTVGLEADNTKQVRGPLFVVSAAVALLLVISAVNVLGVLVARAAARRREIALRVALGAGRLRILRLSLAEGLTLALLGAAVGTLLARAALSVLLSLQPEALRRLGEVRLDGRVVALSLGAALLWGTLFALVPLREHMRTSLSAALAYARRHPASAAARPLALVVGQVALPMVLVGAFLLARASRRSRRSIPASAPTAS
jgi:ABC-type antimicrobial peptide transport system permease subunit